MRLNMRALARALEPVLDVNDCPTGDWALRVVEANTAGLIVGDDKDSPIVPLYDANDCIVGWVIKIVLVGEAV